VRVDLSKKGIPSSRLSIIYAKFDEVARSGTMMVNEPNGMQLLFSIIFFLRRRKKLV